MNRRLVRNMLFLSESDVRKCISMKDVLDVNRKALCSILPGGSGEVPTRLGLQHKPHPHQTTTSSSPPSNEDWTLFKPAQHTELDSVSMGIKIVSVRDSNPSRFGLPTVPATVLVVDPPTGIVQAVLAGTYLTAARTAAGSALATALHQPHARHAVLFGAGLQAQCHIEAIEEALQQQERQQQGTSRRLQRITIVNRSRDRAERLVETELLRSYETEVVLLEDTEGIRRVLQTADVVVTCTNTTTPLFDGSWLRPGCHVNGIGSYTPKMQEVDEITVRRSRILIDTPEARSVGDLQPLLGDETHPVQLIGEVLQDSTKLLESTDDTVDCTFFKSVGTAIQDVMTAALIVERAKELSIGQELDMS